MLAVVWVSEYFRNYLFGRKFNVVTDHKALVSLLNENNKKTMCSRLTRWINRIIPIDLIIEHMPGRLFIKAPGGGSNAGEPL